MNATTPKEKVRQMLDNIRSIRQVRHYTQTYVAAKIGISQNTYSKLELGTTTLPMEYLMQIAAVLGLEPLQLIDGVGVDSVPSLRRC